MSKASPGLEVQFPVKNDRFGCVCAELFNFLLFSEGVLYGKAKLSSRDQVGC